MARIISSRTPEGWPNRCPVCEAFICIEPSGTTGDAPCPQCGQLLWFVHVEPRTWVYPVDENLPKIRRRWERVLEQLLALAFMTKEHVQGSTSFQDVEIDSLDLVELVMELEDDLQFSPEVIDRLQSLIADGQLRTIADLLDFLERHQHGHE